MDTIEKINSVFKSIRNGLSKTLDFIIKIKDILWVAVIIIISIFLMGQCSSKNKLENEVDRLTNNTYALTDSLHHYHDRLGNVIAEKHALQLTQDEMAKTIGELKMKNAEYVAYMNANIGLRDTVYVEKVVYKNVIVDTLNKVTTGTIHLEKEDVFNKSKRYVAANIPYKVSYPSNLVVGNFIVLVYQPILNFSKL